MLCPMSGTPIKMNELITVRFTPLDPSLDRVALLTRQVSLLNTVKSIMVRGQFYVIREPQATRLFCVKHYTIHSVRLLKLRRQYLFIALKTN